MILYANQTGGFKEVNEKPFKLEREIQVLFEKNLHHIMGFRFVKSEFSIKNKRIDTLAFDPQSNAFIIIEYKRDKNMSVVDQGFTYLSLMLENKADFIIEYNESLKLNLKREDVDWSQTRVVFVSSSFTENQILATNFNDIAIELYEVKRFENDIILINPIKKTKSAESIKPLAQKDKKLQEVTNQIIVYSEDGHLEKTSEEIAELYALFKNSIFQLSDSIEVKPKKMEIGFIKNGKIFADICVQKRSLKLYINLKKGQLDDPKNLAEDIAGKGHWGNGEYSVSVHDDSNLEYIMSLIKQAIFRRN